MGNKIRDYSYKMELGYLVTDATPQEGSVVEFKASFYTLLSGEGPCIPWPPLDKLLNQNTLTKIYHTPVHSL